MLKTSRPTTKIQFTHPLHFLWPFGPTRAMVSFLRFLDHTQRRTTVGRTPLDELSARRRDLYLKINNNHSRQTSIPPAGFDPTIPASEGPQTHALDRAVSATHYFTKRNIKLSYIQCDPTFRLKLAIFTSMPSIFLILNAFNVKQTSIGKGKVH